MSSHAGHVSVLQLQFLVLGNRADWPVVQVLVDGREAFVDELPGWQGFDPGDMLGDHSPLLPEVHGRRVAVYRCSCGIEGCGVIAPVIMASPDGQRGSWVDFRDYTGVFTGPTAPDTGRLDGRPWPFQDLHFGRRQYVAEIRRVSGDSSWETSRRVTARLVADGLRAQDVVLPADLRLQWAAPTWNADGVELSFEDRPPGGESFRQVLLRLDSAHSEPEQAAHDILSRLQAIPVSEWGTRFGSQRRRR